MAKYLWVGMAGSTGLTGTNIVDQYCFNKPGNWYTLAFSNGTLRWGATLGTPGWNDSIVFGRDAPVYGSAQYAGWTAAKSPCLFGGYSGGVGSGTWHNTVTTSTGTTFTTALASIYAGGSSLGVPLGEGYPFPWLGGGIAGDIATWCAARDGVGVTQYVVANSSGFRDPTQNLKLKWSGTATFSLPRTYVASVVDGITNPANYDYTTKLIVDFDSVKAYSPIGGGTAGSGGTGSNSAVNTAFNFFSGAGAGLRLRGGSYRILQVNSNGVGYDLRQNPYSYISDSGVEIYNAYIDNLYIYKNQATYVSGCTASTVLISHIPWGINTTNGTYDSQVDLEFASSVNGVSTFTDLYGLTRAADLPSNANTFNLLYNPAWLGLKIESVSNQSQCSETKNVVVLGDRVGNKICNVPTINIDAGSMAGTGTGSGYLYMPWALEFAGTVNCNTINNNAGFIYSNNDIAHTSIVTVSEMKMSNFAVMDFTKRNNQFDDWRFGGFTAAGTQIAGGIVFNDETAKILGSQGLRLWNTQTKAGGVINARLTDVKTYILPTLSAE